MSERENRFLHNLFKEVLYKSNRYVVKGNIGWSVTIEDKHENKVHTISFNELDKFRKTWESIAYSFKDRFLAIICAAKS